jgi:hypothetical protein
MANAISLEIRVNDSILIADSFDKAIEFIVDEVDKWYRSNDQKPLRITITKKQGRSPPALEINVADGIGAKGTMV